ncbi:hypothetical protein TNCT_573011 [Trichonephila clavata]|uniref:Uncharacterized protein n=1 Tax=Trichonephila clavata TaxID=2740835 RepID=A0A8X6IGY4_TRICU|nr:hypothetical protein TNCT_573011 [Trichonephila clavata]
MCGAVSLLGLRVVSGVNRLGGARRTSSGGDEPSRFRKHVPSFTGKLIAASAPLGDGIKDDGVEELAGRKEKPHHLGVIFATDCLVNPNYSAVGTARGFFSIIGGGLLRRKGVVRSQCGRLREKRRAPCDGKCRAHTRVAGRGSKSLQVTRSITLTEPTLRMLHPFGRSASTIAWVFRTFTVGASHVPVVVEIEESIRT